MSTVILGKSQGKKITLGSEARKRGTYVLGTQGTGKTTVLLRMALADMKAGEGLCFITPAGDVVADLLAHVPNNRIDDVILWRPFDDHRPFGFNVFECDPDKDLSVTQVALNVVTETFKRLWGASWGPQMEEVLRIGALTIARCQGMTEDVRPTLADFSRLFTQPLFRERYIKHLRENYPMQADDVLTWWDRFEEKKPHERREQVQSTLNKANRFSEEPFLRNILGQPVSSINLRQLMDNGKIFLVNLSKAKLALDDVRILGSLLVARFYIAALSRGDMPASKRTQFHLIVDEFQNFASYAFFDLFEEARQYGIDITIAHQNLTQLPEDMQSRALGAANKIIFQVTGDDGARLKNEFNVDVIGRRVVGEHARRAVSVSPWQDLLKTSHENAQVRDLVFKIRQALSEWEKRELLHDVVRRLLIEWNELVDETEQTYDFLKRDNFEAKILDTLWGHNYYYQGYELEYGNEFDPFYKLTKDTHYKARSALEEWINSVLYEYVQGFFYKSLNDSLYEKLLEIFGVSLPLGIGCRGEYRWNSDHQSLFEYFGTKFVAQYYPLQPIDAYPLIYKSFTLDYYVPPKRSTRCFFSVGREIAPVDLPFAVQREHIKVLSDNERLKMEMYSIRDQIYQHDWKDQAARHLADWKSALKVAEDGFTVNAEMVAWWENGGKDFYKRPEARFHGGQQGMWDFQRYHEEKTWYKRLAKFYHVKNLVMSALAKGKKFDYVAEQINGVDDWYTLNLEWVSNNLEPLTQPLAALGELLEQSPIQVATGQSEPLTQSVADARDQIGNDLAAQRKYHAWVKLSVEADEQGQFRDVKLLPAPPKPYAWQLKAERIRRNSLLRYGRNRRLVERRIFNRRNPPPNTLPEQTDE